MVEELDLKTYLWISTNEFRIYLFNKKNLKNLYLDQIKFDNKENYIDFQRLDKFLEDNIFKIEKLAGNFIKNVSLLIKNNETNQINFGIKKKNYEKNINQKQLENSLVEVKDIFKENYQDLLIMHMIIVEKKNNFLLNNANNNDDYLFLEVNFISIPNNFTFNFDKLLENYQIKIKRYMSCSYIKSFLDIESKESSELFVTANKLNEGLNKNEVQLVSKDKENKGFFERFFQLFS